MVFSMFIACLWMARSIKTSTGLGQFDDPAATILRVNSEPAYDAFKLDFVHSGMRTICGVKIIRISSSSELRLSLEKRCL